MKKIFNASVNYDMSDYPDFADAYIDYAEDAHGEPLTDEQLDELNEDYDLLYQLIHDDLMSMADIARDRAKDL